MLSKISLRWQILHDSIVVAKGFCGGGRAVGREKCSVLVSWYRVSVSEHENIPKMGDGYGCTAMWMYLMPQNFTLK